MTREEKETLIISLVAQSDNIIKIIRKNIIDSLPSLPEEALNVIIEAMEQ